jgi:predicted GNAT family N-acyltransferase
MNWEQAQPVAGPLRFAIFVGEQKRAFRHRARRPGCNCRHAVAYDVDNKAIGTGRLLPDGHIGRMAVVKEWRRRGVGAEIMAALMSEARKQGHKQVVLSAQLQAAEFYRELGFVAEGKVYPEAGILHQTMVRKL